ncbi:MAG: (deoxy)nucleoside triphosphate pyrophosphohydrolase [Dermabacteraceae bacterium]|uniref:(deoxy)nucleoside triphosphate pyrophosphohydrolase n=1 Tax=Brachybacterium sp. TaxID=1891286 RepID=UPI003F91EE9D
MMILPEGGTEAEEDSAQSPWVRGTCPRCGGDQVLHHVIGMPMLEAHESSPPWVIWEGCVGSGPERECQECGHAWWPEDVGVAEVPERWYDAGTEEELPVEPAPLRVVGAVIVRGEQILIARRAPGRSAARLWEFPGGKIEPDESPQQALVREVREELGVDITVGWLIGRGEADIGDRDLHLDCYWARLEGMDPAGSTDHDRLEWVDRADLPNRDWAGPDVPIVEAIVAGAVPRFGRV